VSIAKVMALQGRTVLDALRNFFDRHIAARPEESQADAEHRARVAAAALLVEVIRSDESFSETERAHVLDAVQRKFDLTTAEARELLTLAETQSHDATDLYQFTSKVNASFSPERKVRLIEELWRVAFADTLLNAHEEHLIRRIADLLHVRHSDYIAAKLRVMAAK
jgi:uncharacterized tellurite resistance protein B-like protein